MPDNEKVQSQWYVLQTKPNTEISLSELINSNTEADIWNIHCYLPTLKQGAKTLPMFKGYLFVCHDENGFHQLNYQTGVKCYVRFGGMPSKIRARDIELMHQVEAHFNGVNSVDSYLVKGMRVRITTGVLAGRTGVLMDSPKGKKVALEIENLGRSLLVQVPPSDLLVLNNMDSINNTA